jgi:hypothetical protein
LFSASQCFWQDSKIRGKFASLPQLPEAGMFDALEPQVVAERRRVLQKYLDALVDTDSVCEDRCVHAILYVSLQNFNSQAVTYLHFSVFQLAT